MSDHTILVNGRPNTGPHPEIIEVPTRVAVCPECGGRLFLQVEAWDSRTGEPADHSIHIDCEHEPDPDDESIEAEDRMHRWWQGEWLPVINRAAAWAARHVRVLIAPPATAPPAQEPSRE